MEVWRKIEGLDDFPYVINKNGAVKNVNTSKILKGCVGINSTHYVLRHKGVQVKMPLNVAVNKTFFQNLPDEEWLKYSSKYSISTHGRVRNNSTYKTLKPKKDKDGYLVVHLQDDERKKEYWRVHRLVATVFLPNPENLPIVDHINREISNELSNHVSNLRWNSLSGNAHNKHKKGKTSKFYGVHQHTGRETFGANIKQNGEMFGLGYFKDEEEAARAYDEKAKELYGEFARLNFP
jgi:hypothetical protein